MAAAALFYGAIAIFIGWLLGYRDTSKRQAQLREQEEKLATERKVIEALERKADEDVAIASDRVRAFQNLVAEAERFRKEFEVGILNGRKWLAEALADFADSRVADVAAWLNGKERSAPRAAETVSAVRSKYREAVSELKLLQYQLRSYEEYFPALSDYRDAILDEAVELRTNATSALEEGDAALTRGYLSKEEYAKLADAEKYQLALDRYWARNKGQCEIGRVYERYIGYLYESQGWHVTYQGIMLGLEDFGRDLICTKDALMHVVQCKCWASHKFIREKHLFQLFGTTVLCRLKNRGICVQPILATTTALSSEALAVVSELDIGVRVEPLQRYPMIKCNVSRKSKDRIYHLPFDQQYDRVVIDNAAGEFFADTTAQAEAAGFRRAFRWRPESAVGAVGQN